MKISLRHRRTLGRLALLACGALLLTLVLDEFFGFQLWSYDKIVPLQPLDDGDTRFDRRAVVRNMLHAPAARLVHQTWRTALVRPDQAGYVSSWAAQNPGYTYVFWDDVDSRLLVSTFFADFLPTYNAYSTPVQRADAARYLLMEVFGGIYADMDFEATRPFDDLLGAHQIAVAPEPPAHWLLYGGEPLLCNAIILSRRRHPFWAFMRKALTEAFSALGSAADTLSLTGPTVFNSAINAWRRESGRPKSDQISVLAPDTFYPIVAKWNTKIAEQCAVAVADGRTRTNICADNFTANTHAVHHWSFSWGRAGRKKQSALPLRELVPESIPGRQLIEIMMSEADQEAR